MTFKLYHVGPPASHIRRHKQVTKAMNLWINDMAQWKCRILPLLAIYIIAFI